jgi:hypothetical protein
MKTGDFPAWIELKVRVNYDAHRAEPYTYQYPTAPASMELNDIIFVTEGDKELKTLEELKEYALNLHAETLAEQAWEDVKEGTATPDDYV